MTAPVPGPEAGARGHSDLARDRALVEQAIGRQLREAEQAIDVLGLNAALNKAKDDLELAIKREQRRAAQHALDHHTIVRMQVTAAIVAPLERLFQLGVREGRAELHRLGITPLRAFVAEPRPELTTESSYLNKALNGLSVRVHDHVVQADLSGLAQDAILRAAIEVPGARAIAAEIISGALTSGLAQTFDQNEDLIGGWEYTAVLDGGTCDPCGGLDGTTYPTWAAIQEVLPNGGPNPDCDGGGRCRCRPVPLG